MLPVGVFIRQCSARRHRGARRSANAGDKLRAESELLPLLPKKTYTISAVGRDARSCSSRVRVGSIAAVAVVSARHSLPP